MLGHGRWDDSGPRPSILMSSCIIGEEAQFWSWQQAHGSPGGSPKSPPRLLITGQVASVEEYIGDSGRELEGAAEEIVESYMGEYMQVWGLL